MKLYELAESYRTISSLCSEGEDFAPALEQIKDELGIKVENVAKVIKELEADEKALGDEATRLSARALAINNRTVGLKKYLLDSMEFAGVDKIEGKLLKVAIQKSPPACEVLNMNDVPLHLRTSILKIPSKELPEDMLHFKQSEQVDKATIIEDWKHEIDTPGTKVTQGKHVRIR